MTTFLTIHHGDTPMSAIVVGVWDDPEIVAEVVDRLLAEWPEDAERDPVVRALNQGRRAALEAVRDSQSIAPVSARPPPVDKPRGRVRLLSHPLYRVDEPGEVRR